MRTGLERLLTLTFGKDGTEANHLGNGWSGDEPGYRWMIGQASELWLNDPGTGLDLILELDMTVLGLPDGGAQRLLVGVRNQAIAQIARARGGTVAFHIPAALLTKPGPVRLVFVHPDFRRPDGEDRDLSFSIGALRLSRVLPRPAPAGGGPLPPGDMIARFESLGDNCEFGLVQRALGAEPLGLLRFSFIELPSLLRGLRCGFEGLGAPGTVEVAADGKDREFVVRETVFDTTYHTFQHDGQTNAETVRAQQTARLGFLKRKLMEDIAAAEKIFVIKRNEPLRPEEVLPIYAALNDLGCNWLLWMLPADERHPSGTLEVLLPGLLRGYVDRFAPYENAHRIDHDAWAAVCEKAWRAVGPAMDRP